MSANLTLTAVDDLNGEMFGTTAIAGAEIDFVNDTFTDTDSTVLSSHTGEVGASWTLHSLTTGTMFILNNRAQKDANAAASIYYASGVPAHANYTVEGLMIDRTAEGRTSRICGWMDTSTVTMVTVGRINSTTLELGKFITGTFTQLDTATVTHTIDQVRSVRIRRNGTDFEWYVDDISQGIFSITDSELSGAGRVGMRMTSNWTADSNYPILSMRAYQ